MLQLKFSPSEVWLEHPSCSFIISNWFSSCLQWKNQASQAWRMPIYILRQAYKQEHSCCVLWHPRGCALWIYPPGSDCQHNLTKITILQIWLALSSCLPTLKALLVLSAYKTVSIELNLTIGLWQHQSQHISCIIVCFHFLSWSMRHSIPPNRLSV